MKVTQLHTILNAVTQEIMGETAIVNEDLSNIVDIGKTIIDSDNVDNYVKKLVNHIGKVVFVDRIYSGSVPSLVMDSWEFGSILQKVSADLPEATENDSWKLEAGKDYSQDVFYQPSVTAKFFNSKVTFDIPLSFTEKQVKESFSNAEQLNGFISMLTTAVENSMTVKLDSLVMRTINNMIGETVIASLPKVGETQDPDLGKTSVRAVNLLKDYNTERSQTLEKKDALRDENFIKYCAYKIGMYTDRMTKISKLFNVDGKERFTPTDFQRVVLLSDFSKLYETSIMSTTFHNENVALPKHDVVPYWQGSGQQYQFNDVSKIDVKTASGVTLTLSGVLGVVFDKDACGVSNLDRRVTTNYNAKAEFYTNFYKFDAGYFNDLSENFVVFFIEDDA